MEKSVYTDEHQVVIELLRRIRKDAGVTQVELAELLGETQSFVSKIERGDRRLDVIELRTVCQCLGSSLADFVSQLERRLSHSKRRH